MTQEALFQIMKEKNLYNNEYPKIFKKCPYHNEEKAIEWFLKTIISNKYITKQQGQEILKQLEKIKGLYSGSISSLNKISTFWLVILIGNHPSNPLFNTAWEYLFSRYKTAITKYFRKLGANFQEAEEWTSDFFIKWMEGAFLNVSQDKGRFRSYLKVCLANFVKSKRKYKKNWLSLDENLVKEKEAEDNLELEYASIIFDTALKRLKEYEKKHSQNKNLYYTLFSAYYLKNDKNLTYEDIAKQFCITPKSLERQLYRAKQKIKKLIKEEIYQTISKQKELETEYQYIIKLLG